MKQFLFILFFFPACTFSSEMRQKDSFDLIDSDELIYCTIPIQKTSENQELVTPQKAKFSILRFLENKINRHKHKTKEMEIEYPDNTHQSHPHVPDALSTIKSITTVDTPLSTYKDSTLLQKEFMDVPLSHKSPNTETSIYKKIKRKEIKKLKN
jgi:hypothetical protein